MGKGTGTEFANSVTCLKVVLFCERKGEVIIFLGAKETLGSGQKILAKKQRMHLSKKYLG